MKHDDSMEMFELLCDVHKNATEEEKKKKTFLNIIGRTYDEDLISRFLAYILTKDTALTLWLLGEYIRQQEVQNRTREEFLNCDVIVLCEKQMGKGRADIFIELKRTNKTVATITIENKIYSKEHDDQTVTYSDWVREEYQDSFNTFFFLRPAFNCSQAKSNRFVNITYSDLLEHMENDNSANVDYITQDFKLHIERYLEAREMMLDEKQIKIINDYETYKKALDITLENYQKKQDLLLKRIREEFRTEYSFEEKAEDAGIGSFRLFKDEWYSYTKTDRYFFYVEIYFKNGKLENATFQETIKHYATSKNEIMAFIRSYTGSVSSNQHHVLKEIPHTSCFVWSDPQWEDEFVEAAVAQLHKSLENMTKTFEEFLKSRNA